MLDFAAKILGIIYYIILILIVIVVLWTFLWPDHDITDYFFGNDKKDETIKNYEDDSDEESLAEEHEKEFKYPKYKPNFEMVSTKSERYDTIKKKEFKAFGYNDFVKLIDNHDFLREYQESLKIMLNEKKKIYQQWLKETENDLKIAQSKSRSNSIAGLYDSSIGRLKIQKEEITQLLIILNDRLDRLSIKTIKKNFIHMIYNKKYGFVSIIGQPEIKNMLANKIYSFSKNPRLLFKRFLNIVLYGGPGLGKSKIAESIAYIYCKSGILIRNKYRKVTQQDFTSKFVSESAELTRKILHSTLEGVIFLDEAYALASDDYLGMRTYNHKNESIDEIVNFMSERKGLSIFIAAGYRKDMRRFLDSNEGLDSRFPLKITLKDYTSKELTDILIYFINELDQDIKLNEKEMGVLYTMIDYVYKKDPDLFKTQARDMELLSSYIIESTCNSEYQWGSSLKSNIWILKNGVNGYLETKGLLLD